MFKKKNKETENVIETSNGMEEPVKTKRVFGMVILIYVFIWSIAIVIVCGILYEKCAGYQSNYEAALEKSNPDDYADQELERFSKARFLKTFEREVLGVNSYEYGSNIQEYVYDIYVTDDLRCVRASQFSDSKPVYDVYVGKTNIGAMTLKQAAGMDDYGFHSFEFDEAAFYVAGPSTEGCYLRAYEGDTIYLNGQLLDTEDSFVTVMEEKVLEKQLYKESSDLTGVTKKEILYYVGGFIKPPVVTFERDGIEYEVAASKDSERIITFSDIEEENADRYYNLCHVYDEEFKSILDLKLYNGFFAAAQAYVLNLNKYGDYSDISKYLDKSGPGYKKVSGIQKEMKWEGKPEQFAITKAEITDIVYFNENTVVVNTHHSIYNVYKGDIYNDDISIQWLYICENGKWYIYDFAYI